MISSLKRLFVYFLTVNYLSLTLAPSLAFAVRDVYEDLESKGEFQLKLKRKDIDVEGVGDLAPGIELTLKKKSATGGFHPIQNCFINYLLPMKSLFL